MFFINPPFGNYVNLPYTMPITGSFTLDPRPGLWGQIWKTLHYSDKHAGWVNQIGLRNRGIDWALRNVNPYKILSIAFLDKADIPIMNALVPRYRNIELNISCPNVKSMESYEGIERFIDKRRKWCIVKVSPLCPESVLDDLYRKGFRQFHCCNTLPVEGGGLSGKAIRPYTEAKLKHLRKYDDVVVIAGGGVSDYRDWCHYKSLGASYVSASSVFFHPFRFLKFYYQYVKNL